MVITNAKWLLCYLMRFSREERLNLCFLTVPDVFISSRWIEEADKACSAVRTVDLTPSVPLCQTSPNSSCSERS